MTNKMRDVDYLPSAMEQLIKDCPDCSAQAVETLLAMREDFPSKNVKLSMEEWRKVEVKFGPADPAKSGPFFQLKGKIIKV